MMRLYIAIFCFFAAVSAHAENLTVENFGDKFNAVMQLAPAPVAERYQATKVYCEDYTGICLYTVGLIGVIAESNPSGEGVASVDVIKTKNLGEDKQVNEDWIYVVYGVLNILAPGLSQGDYAAWTFMIPLARITSKPQTTSVGPVQVTVHRTEQTGWIVSVSPK